MEVALEATRGGLAEPGLSGGAGLLVVTSGHLHLSAGCPYQLSLLLLLITCDQQLLLSPLIICHYHGDFCCHWLLPVIVSYFCCR